MTAPPVAYLDHQASTPPDPRVREAMDPWLGERFGHPASRQHAHGWAAEKAVEDARADVGALVGAEAREIVFTSGGTESDNLAVKGAAEALAGRGRHVLLSAVENRPVLDSCRWLAGRGWEVEVLPVDGAARVDPASLERALRDDTALVCVQWANHEVGTRQPIVEIGQICREAGVLLHVDATNAALWDAIDVDAAGISLLSLSGHKMHGPKGIGALYVRRRDPRVRLAPLLHGGGHERGLRAGTVNVPGAVGLGRAAAIARAEREADSERVGALRDRLEAKLAAAAEDLLVLAKEADRLPGTSGMVWPGVEGEALVVGTPSVAFATGSACTSETLEPSYVLRAMGLPPALVSASFRFGLGRFTTAEEIDRATAALGEAATRILGAGRGGGT